LLVAALRPRWSGTTALPGRSSESDPVATYWWPWHKLGEPYRYSWPDGQAPCNCTPPDLIDTADADAYMATTLKADAWAAVGADKAKALQSAQDALRTLKWCTDEATCCGKELTSSYTAAASELALVLYNNSTAVFGAANQLPTPVVKRQKLGDLEQEFFAPGTVAMGALPIDKRVGRYSPTVLRLYPWLLDLIGCWIDRQTDSKIPLYRS
jgi:hypothetical protein